jgi:dolichol-phosphate mannosyltransferase
MPCDILRRKYLVYERITGVPRFFCEEYKKKTTRYCLVIPVINEGELIKQELLIAKKNGIDKLCDIIICDGGSKDGSTDSILLEAMKVNTLLTKDDTGKQGAQLRMGFWWAMNRGYEGIITIDGNNKDSIEDVPRFIERLDEGYDFVQGSRFIKGGKAINTPLSRYLAVRFIHAPLLSLASGCWFTDTTNAYRAYSKRYLMDPNVKPFRDIFVTYELLAYLSVKAGQLGMKVCEIPVTRSYPNNGKIPTKISPLRGNLQLLRILFACVLGYYDVR